MAMDGIRPAGEGHVNVTVKRIVNGEINYIFVNRVYENIVRLEEREELALLVADGGR